MIDRPLGILILSVILERHLSHPIFVPYSNKYLLIRGFTNKKYFYYSNITIYVLSNPILLQYDSNPLTTFLLSLA